MPSMEAARILGYRIASAECSGRVRRLDKRKLCGTAVAMWVYSLNWWLNWW